MKTIPNLKDLGKRERARLLAENPGMLSRVARALAVTPQTVSRVFHGKIERSPAVQAELQREIAAIYEGASSAA